MGRNKDHADPRVEGIATVGWITLAALGICIPITAIAGAFAGWLAAAIPLAVIFGSGLMAVRIWSSGEKRLESKEHEALKTRIRDLEERLANLEMVDSLEAHFAEKHQRAPPAGELPEKPPKMGPARKEPLG